MVGERWKERGEGVAVGIKREQVSHVESDTSVTSSNAYPGR